MIIVQTSVQSNMHSSICRSPKALSLVGGLTKMAAISEERAASALSRAMFCKGMASSSRLWVQLVVAQAQQLIRIMDTAGTESSCCTCSGRAKTCQQELERTSLQVKNA